MMPASCPPPVPLLKHHPLLLSSLSSPQTIPRFLRGRPPPFLLYSSHFSTFKMADAKAQKRQKFDAVFPKLREELLAYLNQEGMPQDAVSWFQRVRPTPACPFDCSLTQIDARFHVVYVHRTSITTSQVGSSTAVSRSSTLSRSSRAVNSTMMSTLRLPFSDGVSSS